MNEITPKIKVNIITGFLGVGKTTTILNLVAQKHTHEKWAILINEFGLVSIDHAAFEESNGLNIKEIAGGCVCCSASLPMQVTMNRIIKEVQPDRIIIEPTGLGHPANIIDLLRNENYADHLELLSVITVVNPAHFGSERHLEHGTWQDQISLADVLIANKTDAATNAQLIDFEHFTAKLFPKKSLIEKTTFGQSNLSILDLKFYPDFAQNKTHSHAHSHEKTAEISGKNRFESEGFGQYTCGWIFKENVVFDLVKIKTLFANLKTIERIKGVFRTPVDWFLVQKADAQVQSQYVAYRKDSRVEFITAYPTNWDAVERQLNEAIIG